MDLFTLEVLPVSKLMENKGQIDGVPENPRSIRDVRLESLKKSLEDNPEMLQLRELIVYPHEGKYVVLAGNMRLRACKKLKRKDLPCKVLHPDTPREDLRAYVIKDNNDFGEWKRDVLDNLWNKGELLNFGMEMDLPEFEMETAPSMSDDESSDEQDSEKAPGEFKEYDDKIETKCECPKCGYRW